MSGSAEIPEQVAIKLILNDMAFARRYMQGAIACAAKGKAHVPMFCMLRYLSLYVYESYEALKTVAPDMADMLEVDNAQVIERSRHTTKFFDDTNRQLGGISGVTSQLNNISETHRDYFLDNTWFPPAKVLENDLAIYRYRGRLVTTTHALCFHLGLPPEAVKDKDTMGQALMSLSQGQATYISSIAQAIAWDGPSFMDVVDLGAVKSMDIRSSKLYADAFAAGLSDKATAALIAFQCSMNFLALMVAEDPNPDSAEAIFKLKLVTLYHVLSSLAKFKAAFESSLTPASISAIDKILTHVMSAELTDVSKKGLRNTLVHYKPRGAVVAQLTPSQPLCGLVEAYYPNYDFAGMSQALNEHTRLIAQLLDDWSTLG